MTAPTGEHTVDVLIPHIMSPGARLGEYHRTDCRCTIPQNLGEIADLVSLTSAIFDKVLQV